MNLEAGKTSPAGQNSANQPGPAHTFNETLKRHSGLLCILSLMLAAVPAAFKVSFPAWSDSLSVQGFDTVGTIIVFLLAAAAIFGSIRFYKPAKVPVNYIPPPKTDYRKPVTIFKLGLVWFIVWGITVADLFYTSQDCFSHCGPGSGLELLLLIPAAIVLTGAFLVQLPRFILSNQNLSPRAKGVLAGLSLAILLFCTALLWLAFNSIQSP